MKKITVDTYELKNMKDDFIDTVYLIDISENDYTLRRVNNDIYGNPLYKLTLTRGTFVHSDVAHRNYASKQYYLFQSYDIKRDIARFAQSINRNILQVIEIEDN